MFVPFFANILSSLTQLFSVFSRMHSELSMSSSRQHGFQCQEQHNNKLVENLYKNCTVHDFRGSIEFMSRAFRLFGKFSENIREQERVSSLKKITAILNIISSFTRILPKTFVAKSYKSSYAFICASHAILRHLILALTFLLFLPH